VTDLKAAARSARAYTKRKHIAQAELAGAQILDVTIAALAADGHYVIRLYDGEDIHLTAREAASPPVVSLKGTPKIYAPKSWDPANWNRIVGIMQSSQMSKEDALSQLAEGKTLDDKQKAQAIAVLNALPDTPDWYDLLPLAKEKA